MRDEILMVEDDRLLSDIVASRFRKAGWVFYQAGSCQEARAVVRQHTPSVLLLDIGLPDGNGWDLVREVRETGGDPKIIVVSARPITRTQLREHHIDTFVPKPFSIPHLMSTVQAVVRGLRTWTE